MAISKHGSSKSRKQHGETTDADETAISEGLERLHTVCSG